MSRILALRILVGILIGYVCIPSVFAEEPFEDEVARVCADTGTQISAEREKGVLRLFAQAAVPELMNQRLTIGAASPKEPFSTTPPEVAGLLREVRGNLDRETEIAEACSSDPFFLGYYERLKNSLTNSAPNEVSMEHIARQYLAAALFRDRIQFEKAKLRNGRILSHLLGRPPRVSADQILPVFVAGANGQPEIVEDPLASRIAHIEMQNPFLMTRTALPSGVLWLEPNGHSYSSLELVSQKTLESHLLTIYRSKFPGEIEKQRKISLDAFEREVVPKILESERLDHEFALVVEYAYRDAMRERKELEERLCSGERFVASFPPFVANVIESQASDAERSEVCTVHKRAVRDREREHRLDLALGVISAVTSLATIGGGVAVKAGAAGLRTLVVTSGFAGTSVGLAYAGIAAGRLSRDQAHSALARGLFNIELAGYMDVTEAERQLAWTTLDLAMGTLSIVDALIALRTFSKLKQFAAPKQVREVEDILVNRPRMSSGSSAIRTDRSLFRPQLAACGGDG